MRVKPIKRGMWSNYHKTKAKATHHHMGGDYICSNKTKDGYRYVWHYFQYRTWLEKRRFDLSKAQIIEVLPNWMIRNRDYNKQNKR